MNLICCIGFFCITQTNYSLSSRNKAKALKTSGKNNFFLSLPAAPADVVNNILEAFSSDEIDWRLVKHHLQPSLIRVRAILQLICCTLARIALDRKTAVVELRWHVFFRANCFNPTGALAIQSPQGTKPFVLDGGTNGFVCQSPHHRWVWRDSSAVNCHTNGAVVITGRETGP